MHVSGTLYLAHMAEPFTETCCTVEVRDRGDGPACELRDVVTEREVRELFIDGRAYRVRLMLEPMDPDDAPA